MEAGFVIPRGEAGDLPLVAEMVGDLLAEIVARMDEPLFEFDIQ